MNVLHIAQCAGGVDRYLFMLLPLLRKYGIKQILICSFDYDVKKYISEVDEVIQTNLSQSLIPWVLIPSILSIRKVIKNKKPDIVYCHSSIAGGIGRLACIGLPVKIVYNPHGWSFNIK